MPPVGEVSAIIEDYKPYVVPAIIPPRALAAHRQ